MKQGISIDEEVSRIYQKEANLDGLRNYQASIEETGTFSIDPPSYWEVLRLR